MITLSDLYLQTRRALSTQEDADMAAFIARELLCRATGKTRAQFLSDRQMYVTEDICQRVSSLLDRILAGEPLAYVIGEWEFYGMTLTVTPAVLIPRDDTCAVTDLAIKTIKTLEETPRVLDLCTGSGCIGLAIARNIKNARVTLADISREALQVAHKNTVAQKLSGRVACLQADALQAPPAFLGKFDLIVSNPPYITTDEMKALPRSVAGYEPRLALHGGFDGLDFYRAITEKYSAALKPGGFICFEFGMGQGDAVCDLLAKNEFTILERSRDYNDRERAVLARYDRKE